MRTFLILLTTLSIILIGAIALLGWTVLINAGAFQHHAQAAHTKIALPTATPEPLPPTTTTSFFGGSMNLQEVAMTFDDGPSQYTPQILDTLKANHVPATFFCIGQHVQQYPDFVKQEHDAGEIVGNHSWSHPDMTTLSATDISTQFSQTSDIIQQDTGVRPFFFRPPYGNINTTVRTEAAQFGLSPIMWNVDPVDWAMPGVPSIVNTILTTTHNGSVVLMHDGGGNRSESVAALPMIIQGLRQQGFTLVSLPKLINDTLKSSMAPAPIPTLAPDPSFSHFPHLIGEVPNKPAIV